MKRMLLFYVLFLCISIYGQIPSNLEYIQTIDRAIKYEATLLTHNSKLYVDADGGIEEYQILADGRNYRIYY
jgi:hypothetical protein